MTVLSFAVLSMALASCESDFERRVRLEQEAQVKREQEAKAAQAAEEARIRAEELQRQEEERLERVRKEQEAARIAEERRQRFLSNSLRTGERPFGDCWRAGWSGDCGVKVTAPNSHDVLVTMKRDNERGPVMGHVYVAAGGTGEVKVSPGTYQVFFAQGKGWDPQSTNPIPNCEEPGWFVDFYGVGKDEPESFPEGQVWTYTLQPVQQGNFSTEDSDPSEAF